MKAVKLLKAMKKRIKLFSMRFSTFTSFMS